MPKQYNKFIRTVVVFGTVQRDELCKHHLARLDVITCNIATSKAPRPQSYRSGLYDFEDAIIL